MLTFAQLPTQIQQVLQTNGLLDVPALDAVPPTTLQQALPVVSELVVSSLVELAGQSAGREQLWHLAQEAATPAASPLGAGLVKSVLADRFHGTVHATAVAAGLPHAAVPKLLDVVTSAALGLLGGLVAERNWTAAQLAQWLRPHQTQPVAAPVPRGPVSVAVAPVADAAPSSWLRAHWLLLAMGLAAAVEAGYLLGARSAKNEAPDATTSPAPQPVAGAATVAPPAMPKLTDNQGQAVGAGSTESRLYQLLANPSKSGGPASDWITFDRLYFDGNTAVLTASSRAQLSNVASLLKQFPAARIIIGGYTDNTGSPLANLRLSKARAESTRRSLLSRGVPARRLTAVGYGELGNVASNDTEAGRAANRRVSMQVVQQ
jgi:outer membrane protein OmpA-like peptidoglycan-associated protein